MNLTTFIKYVGHNKIDKDQRHEDPGTNKDVRTLLRLSLIVQSGLPKETFKCLPGPVHNARWVTTCSNVLYLYTQEPEPWDGLVLLVKIVINLYTPAILFIKENR